MDNGIVVQLIKIGNTHQLIGNRGMLDTDANKRKKQITTINHTLQFFKRGSRKVYLLSLTIPLNTHTSPTFYTGLVRSSKKVGNIGKNGEKYRENDFACLMLFALIIIRHTEWEREVGIEYCCYWLLEQSTHLSLAFYNTSKILI